MLLLQQRRRRAVAAVQKDLLSKVVDGLTQIGQDVKPDPLKSEERRKMLLAKFALMNTAQAAFLWVVRGDNERAADIMRNLSPKELGEIRLHARNLMDLTITMACDGDEE